MRSPSGTAPGRIRGCAPVAIEQDVRADLAVTDGDGPGAGQPGRSGQHLNPLGGQPAGHVRGLRPGQRLDPGVEPGGVHGRPGAGRVEPDAQPGRSVQRGHQAGGRDQRLGRHAVGQHARAAEAVPLHDRDVGAKLRGDQGRFVSPRPAADDDDLRSRLVHAAQFCRMPRLSPHPSPPSGRATGPDRPREAARTRTLGHRGAVCRLRQQHGPDADGGTLPAFAPAGHRLAGRVAADLRRRGHRLGGRPGHRGRGCGRARIRGAL